MRRRYIVTIITAFMLAAYFTLDEKQDNKQIAQSAIESEPDYIITGLSLENYGGQGKLNQQIESENATHYPHNSSVTFDSPKIILRQGSIPQWGITSNSGQLIQDEKLILTGNIQVVPMQKTEGGFSLSTEQLNIDLENHIADTDSKVTIENDATKLTAIGMNMNMNNQVTQFKSEVRGIHDPNIQ
jgi:lipopolysaccharide export system protein LptC